MSYDWIYKLKPVKEVEPGWWKLRWRPIKNRIDVPHNGGTWNIYREQHGWVHKWWHMWGIQMWKTGVHNGWHRGWDRFDMRLGFGPIVINFWIKWNIIVHEDGPSDLEPRRALDIKKGPPNEGPYAKTERVSST